MGNTSSRRTEEPSSFEFEEDKKNFSSQTALDCPLPTWALVKKRWRPFMLQPEVLSVA
jgi:hypothetical protein